MNKLTAEAEAILLERFGQDSIISLATAENNRPYVRNVDAFYEGSAFYVLTYALSGKIRQIEKNPNVAVSGEWFTASGIGYNLGFWKSQENASIARKMETVFAQWLHNGHNDLEDENTIILKIQLTEGVLLSHGTRYEIDF